MAELRIGKSEETVKKELVDAISKRSANSLDAKIDKILELLLILLNK